MVKTGVEFWIALYEQSIENDTCYTADSVTVIWETISMTQIFVVLDIVSLQLRTKAPVY